MNVVDVFNATGDDTIRWAFDGPMHQIRVIDGSNPDVYLATNGDGGNVAIGVTHVSGNVWDMTYAEGINPGDTWSLDGQPTGLVPVSGGNVIGAGGVIGG